MITADQATQLTSLVKILSIKVAEPAAVRVGLVIMGTYHEK